MQLEQLDLSHNELTSLPIELRKLISLRSLNVSHNKLVNTKDGSEGKTSSDDGKLKQFVSDIPDNVTDGPWDCVGWWYDLEAPPQEIDLSFNQLTRLPNGKSPVDKPSNSNLRNRLGWLTRPRNGSYRGSQPAR